LHFQVAYLEVAYDEHWRRERIAEHIGYSHGKYEAVALESQLLNGIYLTLKSLQHFKLVNV
jgi:hypothetical protein